ncbi:MAG: L,D-transpeptidase [bacterium]|nr:L,D-transpeptidase [bacterium]
MNYFNTHIGLIFTSLALIVFGSSCEQPRPPVANPPASNTAVNTASAVNSQPQAPPSAGANLPVTMPLLDAMFGDESFGTEAKTQLQLTDEELSRVRDAARNSVLELGSDAADDDARSTRNSVEKTRKKIEEIIGAEKTERFFGLVRNRWSAGSQELALSRPNEVPTDTRVVVNAPAYRMDLFKDGQLVKTYKIGIGYPEFPLPTGLRKANEIIFNPTWTPPDEPWVKGKVQPGRKVEAGSKLNPLGPIKIPIGLPSLVHGGKDASKLGTFASHGCVGLTSPMVQDFAVQLSSLSGAPISLDEVKGYEKNKTETKEVKLTNAVPVELRYETIVVQNGSVMIYRDVYERGTNTEENLRKVLESYGVNFDQLPETERSQLLDALTQMAVDASGKAVEEESDTKTKKNTSKTVTRNIKGKKEIAVAVAGLRGKGYPQPVGLAAN